VNADDRDDDREDIEARVREIDRRLAELRETLARPSDEPGDMGDAATKLSVQDEIRQMIDTLENEKRRLTG
jgi:hypothetical protein